MKYSITTQRQIRAQFWDDHPHLPRAPIKDHRGDGLMYPTDTRVAFCDYIDGLCRSGHISSELAERATL